MIPRPIFQLRSLPISIRWEVTRRNPYYYVWWKQARAEHRRQPLDSEEDVTLRQAAIAILGMIGVIGEPPDPARSFAELGSDELNSAWLSGAVHPATMRGLAAILIAALPKSTLAQLGRIFLTAACDELEDRTPRQIEAMQQLTVAGWEGLNSFPNEPLVSINPAASERKITEAVDVLLKEWKEQRGLDERRDRSDKYDEYLEVWDLREGWRNGVYDRSAEQTFREIAASTKRSVSTLNNQYCRAFELITGHRYSRELWFAMFGPIKVTELIGSDAGRTRRPATSPTPRPVPDSVVSSDSEQATSAGSVVGNAQGGSDTGLVELLNDISTMVGLGRTDAQIAAELDLPPEYIPYLRSRDDLSSLRP